MNEIKKNKDGKSLTTQSHIDMELLYYEKIACDMFDVKPEELFGRTKPTNVVLARQFCMTYRNRYYKFSLKSSGLRYNRDHATALHARKMIDNYRITKDPNYNLYADFIKSCLDRLSKMKTSEEENQLKMRLSDTMKKVKSQTFIKDSMSLFKSMLQGVLDGKDKKEMDRMIEDCNDRLYQIKILNEQL